MRAEIVRIDDEKIQLATPKNKLITVPKTEIGFECVVGDLVLIEKRHFSKRYYKIDGEWISLEGKHGKTWLKIALIGLLMVIIIGGSIFGVIFMKRYNEQKQREELEANFNNCLYDGYKSIFPNSLLDLESVKKGLEDEPSYILGIFVGDFPSSYNYSKEYEMAIGCYEKYNIDGYQESINKLSEYKKQADLVTCVTYAEKNGSVSDDEINRSADNLPMQVSLLTRISNGYQEQINCYEKYNTSESQSKTGELRIKKSEYDSAIETSKNLIQNQSRGGMNCTANTIGNYTYMNCY